MIFIKISYVISTALALVNMNYFNVDMYQDKYKNNDIVAQLNIYNTDINKLVVQTNDNEYYLKNSLNNLKDIKGNVFIDYRNDLNDKKIILYGHNSIKREVDFKTLEKYMEYSYYLNHKYINLKTKYYDNKYEIFSVGIYNDNSHLKLNFKNDEWLKHLNNLKNNSIYDTEVSVDNDSILVLQTCSNKYNGSFIVICAKLI